MSIPEIRNVVAIGGIGGLCELLVSLPVWLQDGAIELLLPYLDKEWSSLTTEEVKSLDMPTEESVGMYMVHVQELVDNGEIAASELEARIQKAAEGEKPDLIDELGVIRGETENDREVLKAIKARQEKYKA